MPLDIQCPGCQQRFRAADHLLGKTVKCRCGTVLQIPKPAVQEPLADLSQTWGQDLGALGSIPTMPTPAANLSPYRPATNAARGGRTSATRSGGSLKRDILIALAVTAALFVFVCGGGAGLGAWYAKTHPLPGVSMEERGRAFGTGLGTLMVFCLALTWIPVGIRQAMRLQNSVPPDPI